MNINRLDQDFLKKLTVLYVEDDGDTREQFREFLKRPVGTLISAANGVEGLEAFTAHSPDIVVTDILMPQMDGLTMSYEIRGISPTVPIIVLTAFEQTDYLMRAINIGVDKYVTKPVNSYLLFECLLECAHRLRAEEQLKLARQREIQAMWAKHHETVSILANGMAYDYNNLLHAILGYISIAKMKMETQGESSECLNVDEYYLQASDLGNMLKILGNESREDYRIGNMMPVMRRILEETLQNSTISLTFEWPEIFPTTSFVEQQMFLVFGNIARNAIDAMPAGGSLHLAAKESLVTENDPIPLLPGNYLHVTLTDSGTGIEPHVLPKIFEPYFSTKRKSNQRGTGLSLALCQTIIMKHGGIITAESLPHGGATFHVWLPIPVI